MSFKLFGRTFGKGEKSSETDEGHPRKAAARRAAKIARISRVSKKRKTATKISGKKKLIVQARPPKTEKNTSVLSRKHPIKVKVIQSSHRAAIAVPIKSDVLHADIVKDDVKQDPEKELVVEKWEEDDDEDDLEKFADAPEEVEENDSLDDIV
jgi:hypothetical protein